MTAETRLAETIRLLETMPIQAAASAIEPWAKVHLIDLTKIIEVAKGVTDPRDWVSVYCGKTYGHSPHHWSRYRDDHVPLREPHWCDGEQTPVPEVRTQDEGQTNG